MNKKIKELSDKAKKQVPHGLTPDKWLDVYHEKFAEMIVVKCANVVWDEAEQADSHEINEVGYKLLDSFGIKR